MSAEHSTSQIIDSSTTKLAKKSKKHKHRKQLSLENENSNETAMETASKKHKKSKKSKRKHEEKEVDHSESRKFRKKSKKRKKDHDETKHKKKTRTDQTHDIGIEEPAAVETQATMIADADQTEDSYHDETQITMIQGDGEEATSADEAPEVIVPESKPRSSKSYKIHSVHAHNP